jgi:hypothetical protein
MKKIFYSLLFLFFGYSTVLAQQQVTCGVFTFDVLITPVTCNGDCDGAIQISNISGGTPSYSYFWSTGSTVPSIFNLCADDYTVFISDAMGDTCSMTFTVTQPDSLLVFESVLDASCATCCDGDIVLISTGGSPPYTYVFTPSNPPGTFCPGNYSYCVTDANGCSTCDTVVVSFSNPITFVLTVTPVSCFGSSDGSICVDSLSGGTPPYVYSWNTTPTQAISCATNLSAGTYTVCVTDSNGTTVCNSATVTEPAPIQVTETITDASCATCCDGDIQLIVTGATPPYLVVFSSPSPYCPGNYNYCVLDYNNCSYCDSAEVSFTTSINEDNNSASFMLYPNPTTGSITIMPTTISNETFYISVFNLLGVELLTQSLTAGSSIDLSVYRNGIYLVRIVDKEGKEILVRKAILQR